MCKKNGLPTDVSTAVLIDEEGGHTESTSILRMFAHMGFPYSALGRIATAVPPVIRDNAYRAFAINRGTIWKLVKKVSGMGDTKLEAYNKDRVVGLKEPLNPGWGFEQHT